MAGDILAYVAWDRSGGEHVSQDPQEAIRLAYNAKLPGKRKVPVLLMARRRGEDRPAWLGEGHTCYSVPMGYHVA